MLLTRKKAARFSKYNLFIFENTVHIMEILRLEHLHQVSCYLIGSKINWWSKSQEHSLLTASQSCPHCICMQTIEIKTYRNKAFLQAVTNTPDRSIHHHQFVRCHDRLTRILQIINDALHMLEMIRPLNFRNESFSFWVLELLYWMQGYKKSEVIGKKWLPSILSEVDRDRFFQIWKLSNPHY